MGPILTLTHQERVQVEPQFSNSLTVNQGCLRFHANDLSFMGLILSL